MTLKQKQALLAYLGYYDGHMDDSWELPKKSLILRGSYEDFNP